MGIIGFLGLVCILWALYILVKNSHESIGQQKQIIEELRLLRSLGEKLNPQDSQPAQLIQIDDRNSKVIDAELLDINCADIQALQSLPGVGKVLAQKIIDGRPYERKESLLKVPGISQDLLAQLAKKIRL